MRSVHTHDCALLDDPSAECTCDRGTVGMMPRTAPTTSNKWRIIQWNDEGWLAIAPWGIARMFSSQQEAMIEVHRYIREKAPS